MVELFDTNPLAIYARVFKVDIQTFIGYDDDAIIAGIDQWHGVNRLQMDYKTLLNLLLNLFVT